MCPRFQPPPKPSGPTKWLRSQIDIERRGEKKCWEFLKMRASICGCAILTANPQRMKQTLHQGVCFVTPSGSVAAARHRDKVQAPIWLQHIPVSPLKQVVEGGPVAFLWNGSVNAARRQGPPLSAFYSRFQTARQTQVVGEKTNPHWAEKERNYTSMRYFFIQMGKKTGNYC